MWKPYVRVLAAEVGQALHVLDRFHITSHLNQAVDQVRRAESTRLRTQSQGATQRLKHLRWPLLRRGSRVRGRARQKLHALLASKLATARAWELKETFSYFWHYKSVIWAGAFLTIGASGLCAAASNQCKGWPACCAPMSRSY